jgi:hypothetical protein
VVRRPHCAIGSTHHGIRADAAEVSGEFEQLHKSFKKDTAMPAFPLAKKTIDFGHPF